MSIFNAFDESICAIKTIKALLEDFESKNQPILLETHKLLKRIENVLFGLNPANLLLENGSKDLKRIIELHSLEGELEEDHIIEIGEIAQRLSPEDNALVMRILQELEESDLEKEKLFISFKDLLVVEHEVFYLFEVKVPIDEIPDHLIQITGKSFEHAYLKIIAKTIDSLGTLLHYKKNRKLEVWVNDESLPVLLRSPSSIEDENKELLSELIKEIYLLAFAVSKQVQFFYSGEE